MTNLAFYEICVDCLDDMYDTESWVQVTFSEGLDYVLSLGFDWCHAPTRHQFLEYERLTRILAGDGINHSRRSIPPVSLQQVAYIRCSTKPLKDC
jgi:hypothetical protein